VREVFVVINPVAGNSDPGAIQEALDQWLTDGYELEVYETTGHECVSEIIRSALARGVDTFVAVGGDGTVSGVAEGLVHTGIPLGIVPTGTGNGLARDLCIPMELEDALGLLTGEHAVREIDAMQVGDRFFFLGMSAGVTAMAMSSTHPEDKRRLGRIAYLWRGLGQLLGAQPLRFTLMVDGQRRQWRASEVMIINSSGIGQPYIRWGADLQLDDGRLDVFVVRTRAALDYLILAWNTLRSRQRHDPSVDYFNAEHRVDIDCDRMLPVQADGDVIGHTPVQAHVVPAAVQVIVPAWPHPS
jgi:diacylglycerol kinase (ATP)